MCLIYVFSVVSANETRQQLKFTDKASLFQFVSFSFAWPYTALPSLLYTWQYYDLVDRVASRPPSKTSFYIRAACVVIVSGGLICATIANAYYAACNIYYSDLVDVSNAQHYERLVTTSIKFVCGFVGLCLLGSALLLAGTIYQVHRMTRDHLHGL